MHLLDPIIFFSLTLFCLFSAQQTIVHDLDVIEHLGLFSSYESCHNLWVAISQSQTVHVIPFGVHVIPVSDYRYTCMTL